MSRKVSGRCDAASRPFGWDATACLVGFVCLVAGCSDPVPQKMETPSNAGLYQDALERQKAGQALDAEALESVPELSAADYERIGDQYYLDGRLGLAYVRYQRSIDLDPARPSSRYKVGLVLLKKQVPGQALAHFDNVLTMYPEDALAVQGRGQALLASGRYPEAEEALRLAIAADPRLWKAFEALGVALDAQGRHAEAIAELEQSLSMRPRNPSALNNLGVAHHRNGDYERAVEVLELAGRLGGDMANRARNNQARSLVKLGRWAAALAALEKAADAPRAYNNLGLLFMSEGHPRNAMACFESAIRLSPSHYAKAVANLARAREVAGSESPGKCP